MKFVFFSVVNGINTRWNAAPLELDEAQKFAEYLNRGTNMPEAFFVICDCGRMRLTDFRKAYGREARTA